MWTSWCTRGMEDIVKAVTRLRPYERVQQRTVERRVDLPLLPESAVEVARSIPCERVQQQGVLQPPEETVEAVRSIPCERVQQRAVERMVDKSTPQTREESVAVVEKIPQEPISERIGEQSEVIEVTETTNQENFAAHSGADPLGPCRGCQNFPSEANF